MIFELLAKIFIFIFYPACSPSGRQKRIEKLMEDTGEMREVCAAIVYTRDAKRVPFTFTADERKEAFDILELVQAGRLRLPADRVEE